MVKSSLVRGLLGATLLLSLTLARAEEQAKGGLKTEFFDKDPGWEAHNNRIVPERLPTVIQDFGFSMTNFAGKGAGELGGRIVRASEPAFYADKIGPLTL